MTAFVSRLFAPACFIFDFPSYNQGLEAKFPRNYCTELYLFGFANTRTVQEFRIIFVSTIIAGLVCSQHLKIIKRLYHVVMMSCPDY